MLSFHLFVKHMPRSQTIFGFCGGFPRVFFSTQSESVAKYDIFSHLKPEDISPKSNDAIAGRKWLPGSQGKGFPQYLAKPKEDFPHALQLQNAGLKYSRQDLVSICRRIIENDLSKYGTILFRGLPLTTTEDFADFSFSLGYKAMDYTGGSANRKVVNKKANVYTANDDPSSYTIELHNELAYAPVYPRKLLFFCLEEPGEGCGGYTLLCDGKQLLNKINPDIMKKLEEKQVRYWYRVPHENNTDYRSWQDMFNTSDKKIVEQFLAKDGFDFSWDPKDESLEFWITRPAFITHPDTREKLWFNHVYRKHISTLTESPMFPSNEQKDRVYIHNSCYGDGCEVEPDDLQHIRAMAWECTVGFQWKTGDVLVVDNYLALHGRLGFKGNRKILANLLAN